MVPGDPYQTPHTGEEEPSPGPRFAGSNWDFKTRLFFIVPGLLCLFSGILFPLFQRTGIPTPKSGLFFIVTAIISSVFSTRYVLRYQKTSRPALLLTFLSHLLLQAVSIFGLTVLIMMVSNIL